MKRLHVQGIAWETFHTLSEIAFSGEDSRERAAGIPVKPRACRSPQPQEQ